MFQVAQIARPSRADPDARRSALKIICEVGTAVRTGLRAYHDRARCSRSRRRERTEI